MRWPERKPFIGALDEPIRARHMVPDGTLVATENDIAQAKLFNEAEGRRIAEEIERKFDLLVEHYNLPDKNYWMLAAALASDFVRGFQVEYASGQPATAAPPPLYAPTKSEAAYIAARNLWSSGGIPPSREAQRRAIEAFIRDRLPTWSHETFSASTIRDAVARVKRETGATRRQNATRSDKG